MGASVLNMVSTQLKRHQSAKILTINSLPLSKRDQGIVNWSVNWTALKGLSPHAATEHFVPRQYSRIASSWLRWPSAFAVSRTHLCSVWISGSFGLLEVSCRVIDSPMVRATTLQLTSTFASQRMQERWAPAIRRLFSALWPKRIERCDVSRR